MWTDASVRALVGELPAVAPPAEDVAVEPAEERMPEPSAALRALRRSLEEAIGSLQEALEQLGDLVPDTTSR